MAEPFKDFINPTAVRRLADQIQGGTPSFPADAFTAAATPGLAPLELKGRVRHVAVALRAHLPAPWPEALSVLRAGMGPALPGTDSLSVGFYLWPMLQVVEDFGLEHPALSMDVLHEMTRRFSAEFAVRPYLARHPEVAWPLMTAWASHEDVHVRRLASEGSRPRLPWGIRLRDTTARGLVIIERLKDDPEKYVQKSVANHLNDISREDTAVALATARRWSVGAGPGRTWVVRHALRSLLKAGNPDALALMGFGPPDVVVSGLALSADAVAIGQAVTVTATITARSAQALMVDVSLGMQRKRGVSHKVFKAGQRRLAAGESWAWSHKLSMRPVTTRKYYPGAHSVSVQINGQPHGTVNFSLTV